MVRIAIAAALLAVVITNGVHAAGRDATPTQRRLTREWVPVIDQAAPSRPAFSLQVEGDRASATLSELSVAIRKLLKLPKWDPKVCVGCGPK